jgi:hypothetical protein
MAAPRAFAALAALAVAVVLLVARPSRAAAVPTPVVVETGAITVRAETGLDDLAHELAADSGDHLRSIAADLADLPTPDAVEIYVVTDAADMQSVAPGGRAVPGWAAGVAFPDLGVVIVATRRGPQLFDVAEVLHHELAHLALGAALGRAAPRWLHEGFAYQHSAEWTFARVETLAGMAWGSTIPIEDLDHSFPAEELPAHRAYAESYDFVGYLARRGRYEDTDDDGDRYPFRRFLASLGRGDSLDRAAIGAFGRPIRDLFEEWEQDLSRRFLLLPAGVFAALIWIVAALLLYLAFRRRRRQNRARLADWERQDAEADARRAAWLATLASVPEPDPDDSPARPPPHLLN